MSCHMMSCLMRSCHIIWCHLKAYGVIGHHVTSWHTISYHISYGIYFYVQSMNFGGDSEGTSLTLPVCVCRSAARNTVPDLGASHRGSHGGESVHSHRGHRSVAGWMRPCGNYTASLHCSLPRLLKGLRLMVGGWRSGAWSEPGVFKVVIRLLLSKLMWT